MNCAASKQRQAFANSSFAVPQQAFHSSCQEAAVLDASNWKRFVADAGAFWLHLPTSSIIPPQSSIDTILNWLHSPDGPARDLENLASEDAKNQLTGLLLAQQVEKREDWTVSRIAIAPTHRCNLRCSYCYLKGQDADTAPDIDQSSVNRIFAFLDENSLAPHVNVAFIGGEPLLYSGLDWLIAEINSYFRKRGIVSSFSLTTNGTYLASEKALELINKWNIRTGVSLDGPLAVHDACRLFANGSGSYAAVVNGVNAFKQHCPQELLSVRATVSLSRTTMSSCYSHLVMLGFQDIAFGIPEFSNATLRAGYSEQAAFEDIDELYSRLFRDFSSGRLRRFAWANELSMPSILARLSPRFVVLCVDTSLSIPPATSEPVIAFLTATLHDLSPHSCETHLTGKSVLLLCAK